MLGVLLGILLLRYGLRPKNQILYCREKDGRGLELNVDKEDAISLETKSSPELRFFKYGRSYEFRKRGRAFTRFFGKEGTAYTWLLQGFKKVATKFEDKPVEVPVLNKEGLVILDEKGHPVFKKVKEKVPIEWEEQQAKIEFPTLEDAVKFRWGDFYDTVPDPRKVELREDKILLTVNLEPGIVPEGYEPITERTIKKKANEDMAELMARSLKGVIKTTIMDWLPWLLAGAGIMAVGSKVLGWW